MGRKRPFFMPYKIVDNFLNLEAFKPLQETIVYSGSFPWHLTRGVSHSHADDGYYFIHLLYTNRHLNGNYLNLLTPILESIDYFALKRIKANFYPTTNQIKHHDYHSDFNIPHRGLLFYLNTNNGKTIFKDGTEIESVANRALFFDPSIQHKSTTCTDDPVGRFNINFNYI